MPFDIKTPIAYGWVPNDSGNATEAENIESRIGSSGPDNEFVLLYELYEDDVDPSIAVSPIDHPEIMLSPAMNTECVSSVGTSVSGLQDPRTILTRSPL